METFSDPSHKFVVVGMGRFVKTIHMAAFNEMIAAHYN